MSEENKLSRRDFLKLAAAGVGTFAIAGAGITFLDGCAAIDGSSAGFLTDGEFKLVEAVAEQIIPTDDWPGGREAGVANFIDIQLRGPYRRFQDIYRGGLAGIDDTCRSKFNAKFEALPFESQTRFLLDMQHDRLDGEVWKEGFSGKFFELLRAHCLQGYYGSPRHGGNKDFISYRMIGLDYPQIVGQNRYGS
jgi:gluconate 2-dehydrogenase gamma chain